MATLALGSRSRLTVQASWPSRPRGIDCLGHRRGPFSPSSIVYTLTNSGVLLSTGRHQSTKLVTLSAASGTLAAGASTTVTVSINSGANSLAAGNYNDTVNFVNTTTGNGNTRARSRSRLTVQASWPFRPPAA
jgi:hypothetical protein